MADFEMYSGDTKNLRFPVTDLAGEPVELMGSFIRFQMARSVNAKVPTLEKVIDKSPAEISLVMVDLSGGGVTSSEFIVHLLPDDTEELRGDFYYESEVILTDGTVGTVRSGTMTINPDLIHKRSGA